QAGNLARIGARRARPTPTHPLLPTAQQVWITHRSGGALPARRARRPPRIRSSQGKNPLSRKAACKRLFLFPTNYERTEVVFFSRCGLQHGNLLRREARRHFKRALSAAFQTPARVHKLVTSHAWTVRFLAPEWSAMGRDGMDTALPSGMKGWATNGRLSRTEGHRCAKVKLRCNHLRNGGPEMNATTYGLDVAKRVFQMYWVDAQTGE